MKCGRLHVNSPLFSPLTACWQQLMEWLGSGRWREMYLMSVDMFLLLYSTNSLRGQSGRYPMYRGVQMYNSALFLFIVWVQYFLN